MQRLYEEKEEDEERTIGARIAASRAVREDRKEDCNEGANGVKECGGEGKERRRAEEKKKRLKDPSTTSTIHLLKFPSAQCVSPVRSVEILHPNVDASS